ncbi:ankyrin repeat domain-containing protein [Stenotrophomonas muris]|uniref:ankyrin repeat domain-containing protein n=1 Tax=Stenotrophomonas muris TaxID=2963283 RepID=UPI003F8123D3
MLTRAGADVIAQRMDGQAPIHRAIFPETIEALAKAGADMNAQDNNGNTSLHAGRDATVWSALIEAGADPHIQNQKGEAPINSGKPFFNDLRAQERAKLLVSLLPPANAWKPPEGGFGADAKRQVGAAMKAHGQDSQTQEAPRLRARF